MKILLEYWWRGFKVLLMAAMLVALFIGFVMLFSIAPVWVPIALFGVALFIVVPLVVGILRDGWW